MKQKRTRNYRKFFKNNCTYLFIGAIALIAAIVTISVLASKNKSSKNHNNSSSFLKNDTNSSLDDSTSSSSSTDEEITNGGAQEDESSNSTATEEPTEKPSSEPVNYKYSIRVNLKTNCVTIYTKDENGNFTVPFKAMACSVGKKNNETPLGTFGILRYYNWCRMVDWTYSQFAYRIHGSIMFHSTPSALALNMNTGGNPSPSYSKGRVEVAEFNKLGSNASLGCVRLTVADAKWICDNCPAGTVTNIVSENSDPLPKPEVIKISDNIPAECGGYVTTWLPENHNARPIKWVQKKIYVAWDPTDPDPNNPWNKYSPTITCDSTLTVSAGSSVSDILQLITAKDTCGNMVNNKVTVSGSYDLNKIGKYTIKLSLTDALKRNASKTVTLVVKKADNVTVPTTSSTNIETATTDTTTNDTTTKEVTTADTAKETTTDISSDITTSSQEDSDTDLSETSNEEVQG